MPSSSSLATVVVAYFVHTLLAFPLTLIHLVLARFTPLPPQTLGTAFALLKKPFNEAARAWILIGVAFGTLLNVEKIVVDQVGDRLNALISSNSSSSARPACTLSPSSALRPALSEARAQLDLISAHQYPLTLSSLLDKPLALPTAPEGAPPFSVEEVAEWEAGSGWFRGEFERLAEEATRGWVETITFNPASPSSSSSSSSSDTAEDDPCAASRRHLASPLFLSAVQAELQRVQAGSPSPAVYAASEFTDADWAREDARVERKEAREQAKLDRQFEGFLDTMFEKAAELGGAAAAEKAADATAEATGKRPRELLDQPQDPSRPAGPENPMWRETLRGQWDAMHDPRKGGVMGEAMGALAGMFGGDDEDEEEDDDEEGEVDTSAALSDADKSALPAPLPLMVNHLLRDHLAQAVALSTPSRLTSYDLTWSVDPDAEAASLPPFLGAVPDAQLSPLQLATRIDQRARAWASYLLSYLFTPPTAPAAPVSADALTARERAELLRRSPFPAFLRAAGELRQLPFNDRHPRVGVNGHEAAFVVFANREQAEKNGKGTVKLGPAEEGADKRTEQGASALVVQWAKRRVWELERELEDAVRREEREARKEGGVSESVTGREEL
ncbi:hypothetical protein JCM10207_003295 [Rhodosporidiobolus poonsookiae]